MNMSLDERQQQVDDDNCRWSKHLHDDLIELIVKRLTLVDSIRFAAVCPSWRRVSSQWLRRVTRLPWLLKSVEFVDSETVNYSLQSPSEETAYDFKFPRESASSEDIICSGTANGWLIMSEIWKEVKPIKCTNYLLNPITGDRIMLPPVTEFMPHVSSGSSDPRSADCIVITKNGLGFNFCRPGSQNWSWMTARPFRRVDFMKFHRDNGRLYVTGRTYDVERYTDYDHVLIVFVPVRAVGKDDDDRNEEEITWCKERVIKVAPREPWTGVETTNPWLSFAGPAFTLSSKGKLWLVWMRNCSPEPDPSFFLFHVVKIDDDGWPGWGNSVDFHVVKKGIWAAYDASEDELVIVSYPDNISVPNSESFTTKDERFFRRLCGTMEEAEEDGLSDNIEYGGKWFMPNIAAK